MNRSFPCFLSVAMLLGTAFISHANGKGLSVSLRGMLMFRPVEVIVRAHAALDGQASVVVDQGYLGPYKAGNTISVDPDFFHHYLLVPGRWQPEVLLILTHKPAHDYELVPSTNFSSDWAIEERLSKRISDGRVYLWYTNTKTLSYHLWYPFTDTASLIADEIYQTDSSLENDLSEGLLRHADWEQAKAATDPALRLELLRRFLIPGGEHHMTTYEIWSCNLPILEEVEKAGPASISFLKELLNSPYYQNDYAPDGWRGLGSQLRAAAQNSLALVGAKAAIKSADKLALVRPVFDVPSYETVAGADGPILMREYLDRALGEVVSLGPEAGLPFLRDLLTQPQFQDGYARAYQGYGHDQRAKILAAMASLQ